MSNMEKLYRINDAIGVLASEFGIRSQFAAGADAEFDGMLQDAALAVAAIFWPDGDPSKSWRD